MNVCRLLVAVLICLLLPVAARSGDLVVGANIGNVPWEFADDRGDFVGFEIDLIEEVARRLGHDVEIVNIPFNGLFSAVQSGRIDVALSSVTITDRRLASVAFAQPYYDSAQSLTVGSHSTIAGLEDLAGTVIGVDTGSTGDMWTSANRERYGVDEIRRYEGLAPAMLDLQTRRIDAYISDIPSLLYFAKDKPQFRVVECIETGERYSMMFARRSRWLEPVDAQISVLKREGFLAGLHRRWFGSEPAPRSSTVQVVPRPVASP